MFISRRLRRLKSFLFSRDLFYSGRAHRKGLIQPVFFSDKQRSIEGLSGLPSLMPIHIDELTDRANEIKESGIPVIALFPVVEKDSKDDKGSYALKDENIIFSAIERIKSQVPKLGIMCDVALDPFTDHGHDGILDQDGIVDNDATVDILAEYALMQAQAGCQILAPSDMMDGRVACIRRNLEENKFNNTLIFSYTKFISNLYKPFRMVLGSQQENDIDKSGYQISTADFKGSLESCMRDLQEGADALIIKPASLSMDLCKIISEKVNVPIFLYQVSGEYASIQSAIDNNWLSEEIIDESFEAFKRAGASGIISYFALEYAKKQKNK